MLYTIHSSDTIRVVPRFAELQSEADTGVRPLPDLPAADGLTSHAGVTAQCVITLSDLNLN